MLGVNPLMESDPDVPLALVLSLVSQFVSVLCAAE